MSGLMTMSEAAELAEAEQVIERGIKTFTEVGNALLRIRDGRLYRAEFDTFENYCRERWGFTQQYATSLVRAADLAETMVSAGLPAPQNERQARELGKVPEPERAEVWRETVERTGGKPTAAAIRETYRPDPDPQPEPEPDGPDHDEKRPDPEPGIWYSGPTETADTARLDAELDAAMEGTVQRFRSNFARASVRAGEVTTFDADRIAEVFAANWNRDVGDLVRQLREWCDDVESAHRRQSSGLRIVKGGAQ